MIAAFFRARVSDGFATASAASEAGQAFLTSVTAGP